MNAYRQQPLRYPWPPMLFGIAIIAALLAHKLIGILPLGGGSWRSLAGLLLAAFAVAIDVWAAKTLIDSHTPVMHTSCAQRLVTTGPFRFSRNPIYLGYTLMTVALGLITGNAWFLITGLIAAAVTGLVAVRCEEMHLLARFGIDFEQYCRQTRRWI
ncbi:methyltransferase family protein [Rhizobium sp. SL42]|uniref:methyltransferase family protein n=1 Tax=Rhizobium sp. SL42 TaxID=2806346 RepID=UPI001F39B0AB|nr:isoprenylcysteine carboxylmethyltransferase family protein [Rhizobium sp. SL42]UJW73829.1 isoprenylcysteine carboxylmethyltransferase family protein [Rhizobium sp. SL42]